MRAGTHRDQCNSDANHAVLHAKATDEDLGPLETSISGANHAVLHAQNDRSCLGPIETCYSGPKVSVLHAQYIYEGWDP